MHNALSVKKYFSVIYTTYVRSFKFWSLILEVHFQKQKMYKESYVFTKTKKKASPFFFPVY